MLFADDIALISHTPVGLQNQINVLARASDRLGLKVNLEKTKVMIFRRGGYLTKHEKWFYQGTRLEVVNSYTYLGFNLTTKLTLSSAMEQITKKAKRKVIDILRALWKIECNDIKVFLRLFDQQVQPALLYAAEVWGTRKVLEIERVQLYACKKILSVSQKTPNAMVYGELGRYPLFVQTYVKAVKYWLKLLEMPDYRIPKSTYNCLKRLDENGIETWVSEVKQHLFQYGFGYVWVAQQVGCKSRFIKVFKQRLVDCYAQEWHDKINSSNRYYYYRSFKHCLEFEHYLSALTIRKYRDAVVRFRVGVNELHCNKYRFNANLQLKICPLCKRAEEDEIHFMFVCPHYDSIRKDIFPLHLSTPLGNLTDLENVMQLPIKSLADFIVCAFSMRRTAL